MNRAQAVAETSEAIVLEAETKEAVMSDANYRVHDEYVTTAYDSNAVRTVVVYWYKLRADVNAPLVRSHYGVK
jgi:hypothetical protein